MGITIEVKISIHTKQQDVDISIHKYMYLRLHIRSMIIAAGDMPKSVEKWTVALPRLQLNEAFRETGRQAECLISVNTTEEYDGYGEYGDE